MRFSPKHLVEATASEITCITRREKSMLFDFRLKHHESHVNIISCDIVSSEHKSNLDLVAKRSDTGLYIYIFLFIDFKG